MEQWRTIERAAAAHVDLVALRQGRADHDAVGVYEVVYQAVEG